MLLTNTPLFLLRQNDLFLKTQLLAIENIVTFPQLCIDSIAHSSQSWSKEWINRLKKYEDYYDPLFFLSPKWLLAQFKTYCLLKYWDFPLRTCLNKRFFINWGGALRIDWLKMMIKWRINIFFKKYFLNHLKRLSFYYNSKILIPYHGRDPGSIPGRCIWALHVEL